MLAHIFNTAKGLLGLSVPAQDVPRHPTNSTTATRDHTRGIEVTMVTTRRGTETPGQEATPRSSVKRKAGKRELDAADTPTAAKRQRRSLPKRNVVDVSLPAEAENDAIQDSTEDISDTIVVAVPGTKAKKDTDLPFRRRTSPKVVVAKLPPPVETVETESKEIGEAVDDDAPPMSTQDSVYETPATHKAAEGSLTPRDKTHNGRTPSKKSSGRKKKAVAGPEVHLPASAESAEVTPTQSSYVDEIPSSTYESEQAPVTSQDAPLTPPQPEKTHVRFGSEEPDNKPKPIFMNLQGHKRYEAPVPTQHIEPEVDDDGSDSDEAPEIVTTSAAALKAKASEQDTTRALLAQQEKARKKREDRERRVAEEQAAKRAREEKKAKKLAKKLARQQQQQPTLEEALGPDVPSVNPSSLPTLLPDSLLSTIPDHRAPTPPPELPRATDKEIQQAKLKQHIKFLERTYKGPKDKKKGKLSVAVLDEKSRALPPKANRDTKNVRERWLMGREKDGRGVGMGRKVERKAFGNKGFLRGDDE